MVEPFGDAMHHRVLQPVVMQHGRVDKGGELRFAADDIFRLGPYPIPDRIERRHFPTLRIDLMHCHGCSKFDFLALLCDGRTLSASGRKTAAW
jgi:hypothetical protein